MCYHHGQVCRCRLGPAGTLTPLNDLIERDGFDIGQYMSWAVEEVTLGDKYYGLPHNADSRAFYWNKDPLC